MWEILLIYIKMMMNEVLIQMGSIKFVGTDSGQTTSYYYISYVIYNTPGNTSKNKHFEVQRASTSLKLKTDILK